MKDLYIVHFLLILLFFLNTNNCFAANNANISKPVNLSEIKLSDKEKNVLKEKELTKKPLSDKSIFYEYMRDLQAKIKANWYPPRGENSKKVVVLFTIEKDGTLKKYSFISLSGDEKTDAAAVEAIKKSIPFSPLPKEYQGKEVDIQFSFDYNVINKDSGSDEIIFLQSKIEQAAKKYFAMGKFRLSNKEYNTALLCFNKSIELTPEIADYYFYRAITKSALNNHKGAIKDYNKVIEFSKNPIAFHNRAYEKSLLGKYKDAIKDYNFAVELNPQYAKAYQNLAVAEYSLNNYENAYINIQKAMEIYNSNGNKFAYESAQKFALKIKDKIKE